MRRWRGSLPLTLAAASLARRTASRLRSSPGGSSARATAPRPRRLASWCQHQSRRPCPLVSALPCPLRVAAPPSCFAVPLVQGTGPAEQRGDPCLAQQNRRVRRLRRSTARDGRTVARAGRCRPRRASTSSCPRASPRARRRRSRARRVVRAACPPARFGCDVCVSRLLVAVCAVCFLSWSRLPPVCVLACCRAYVLAGEARVARVPR